MVSLALPGKLSGRGREALMEWRGEERHCPTPNNDNVRDTMVSPCNLWRCRDEVHPSIGNAYLLWESILE